MIGAAFAGASGILLAPSVGLDALVLTFVVVQAFGAAAVGRFQSTARPSPAASASASSQSLLNAPTSSDVVPFVHDLPGLDQACRSSCCSRSCSPPGRAAPRAGGPPSATVRAAAAAGPGRAGLVVVGGPRRIALPLRLRPGSRVHARRGVRHHLRLAVPAHRSVQPGLAVPGRLRGLGATTSATSPRARPALAAGVVAAGLVAVPMGAIVAIPAIRLSGLFLALATLGFGVLVEKLLYPAGVHVRRDRIADRRTP